MRIATHAEFRPLVEEAGLEFYPLAGDPHELMDYMVKTGGRIVPTHLDQIVEDVPRKRAMIAEILESTWRACTEPDPGSTRRAAVHRRRASSPIRPATATSTAPRRCTFRCT